MPKNRKWKGILRWNKCPETKFDRNRSQTVRNGHSIRVGGTKSYQYDQCQRWKNRRTREDETIVGEANCRREKRDCRTDKEVIIREGKNHERVTSG